MGLCSLQKCSWDSYCAFARWDELFNQWNHLWQYRYFSGRPDCALLSSCHAISSCAWKLFHCCYRAGSRSTGAVNSDNRHHCKLLCPGGKSSTVFYVYNPGFSSSNNWINDTPLTYARYRNNGHVNQPGYPIFCIHWSWRQYDADGTSLASDPFSDLFMYPTPVYMD